MIWIDPRGNIFLLLLLVWSIGVMKDFSINNIIFPLFSSILFTLLDLFFIKWKFQKWYYPFSPLVSGLLIGLIIHHSSGIIPVILAVLFAFISKHVITIKGKHVFNPAAFGIVASSTLTGVSISWWAVAWGGAQIPILILSAIILYKIKRLKLTGIFLMGYFIFMFVNQGFKPAISLTFDGTVFLFAFIMLPEPMTSLIEGIWKYIYSLVVLAIIYMSQLLHLSLPDNLLVALLVTNLLGKIYSLKKK